MKLWSSDVVISLVLTGFTREPRGVLAGVQLGSGQRGQVCVYGRRTSADHVLERRPHQTTPPTAGEGDLPTHNAILVCPWASHYLRKVATDTNSMTTKAFLQRSKWPRDMSLTTQTTISFTYKHSKLMSSSGTRLAQRQTAFPQKDNDATPRTHQIISRRGIAAERARLLKVTRFVIYWCLESIYLDISSKADHLVLQWK